MSDFNSFKPIHSEIKIAVASRDNQVDDHFGHCQYFTVFTIQNKKVVNKEILHSPDGCGCKSNITVTLNEKNVTEMLAGTIGQGAISKLNAAGISVIRGCSGGIDSLLDDYLAGKLSDSGQVCSQHGDGHSCSH